MPIDEGGDGCDSRPVNTVESFLDDYHRRYEDGNMRAVADLCVVPFLAVRRGEAIHMADRGDVVVHFASTIGMYRSVVGAQTWKRLETDVRQLGDRSVFVSVHWNALDADGQVLRNTWTSYHLLAVEDEWRMLSYTNHF